MEEEIWSAIEGFEDYYEISTLGNVRSLPRVICCGKGFYSLPGRFLKPGVNTAGYDYVNLSGGGCRKTIMVHLLVARAFIPNPENKPCIDHINGNKKDNRVTNLRWCTYKENNNFDLYRSRQSEARRKLVGVLNPSSKPVSQFSKDGEYICSYPGMAEAERKTGVDRRSISSACRSVYKTAGGYIWKYADPNELCASGQ